MRLLSRFALLLIHLLLSGLFHDTAAAVERQVPGDPYTVGYSPRGLLIDGTPRVLTTASIHYPRSTPGMWDSLMKKAKQGGINTIDTYVFWNMHEKIKGQYDFATDRANLPLFLETAKKNGLFVMLRIGPYVCAEWNYGGFPHWLRYEPNIVFRTNSEPFMREMKKFITKVVDVSRPFLPENGGPLIGMQIENELGDHQWRFGKDGERYADFCGETAGSFNLTIPWIMCRQYYHVNNVIPTQNDFYCDQYLDDYHKKYPQFPDMWTEMWPGWFQRWGEPAPYRPIEDVSYAVAKWYAYGGTYVAYYMYQGGTNFGRTSGPFIMTSYDYAGFLDQYGLENWPKYLHLAELHNHLLDNQDLITGNPVPKPERLANNDDTKAHVYGDQHEYLAFLVNTNPKNNISVEFDGLPLSLHRWSVTLVKKVKGDLQPHVLYNTATLSKEVKKAQQHPPGFEQISCPASTSTGGSDKGVLLLDDVRTRQIELPDSKDMKYRDDHPREQITLTRDTTDYLWYRTTVDVPKECNVASKNRKLELQDAGDLVYVYFDNDYVGWVHGRHDTLANFAIDIPEDAVNDKDRVTISILSQTMGMAHNQANMEAYARGLLGKVLLCGTDITRGEWLMQPGLDGDIGDTPVRGGIEPQGSDQYLSWTKYKPNSDAKKLKHGARLRWYAIEVDTKALLQSERQLRSAAGASGVDDP
ncbi:Beta-galactosidase-1-like protein, partial [Dipsacomyces acuminosporus]